MADAFECGNEFSGSIKRGEFDYLRNYNLLKKILFHAVTQLYTLFKFHIEV